MQHIEDTEEDDDDSVDSMFAEESQIPAQPLSSSPPWKILIVDDEKDVHITTKLALQNVIFEGRGLQFISSYSGIEAIRDLKANPDTALILLDVVMERDDAGLRVVQEIRNVLQNNLVRIILRTGQPGQAPEKTVVVEYDINDYKAKTELTTIHLFSTVISALRGYRDLKRVEVGKQALLKIVYAADTIFHAHSFPTFVTDILRQIVDIMPFHHEDNVVLQPSSLAASLEGGEYGILAGTGIFGKHMSKEEVSRQITPSIRQMVAVAFHERCHVFEKNDCALYIQGRDENHRFVTFLRGYGAVSDWEKEMIDILVKNIAIAYDNACTITDLKDTVGALEDELQKEQEANLRLRNKLRAQGQQLKTARSGSLEE